MDKSEIIVWIIILVTLIIIFTIAIFTLPLIEELIDKKLIEESNENINYPSGEIVISKCVGINVAPKGEIILNLTDREKRILIVGALSSWKDPVFPLTLELQELCPYSGNKTYETIEDIPLTDDCIDKNKTSCYFKFGGDFVDKPRGLNSLDVNVTIIK